MSEPLDAEDDPPPPPPAAAEDRKAQAAMSTLETRHNEADDEAEEAKQKQNRIVDQAELSAAISRLEVSEAARGKSGKGRVKSEAEVRREEKKAKEAEERARRAKVKVEGADVTLLVEELDMSKGKATEFLKAHEGDVVRAMRAFVKASG